MSSPAASVASPTPRRVIIDTDVGCDDALAILLAMKAQQKQEIIIQAFTTVFGNVPLKQATENVWVLSRIFGCTSPFYEGASCPMVQTLVIDTWEGHGKNGLGDATFPEHTHQDHAEAQKMARAALEKEHAVNALIRLSHEYVGEIDIVALGPLTNIALAINLDREFAKRIRSIVIMGGSSHAKGNTTLAGEFNFYCDPEAAHVVVSAFSSSQLVIVPWELTQDQALTWHQFDELAEGQHVEAVFLKKTHRMYEHVARGPGKGKIDVEADIKKAKLEAQAHVTPTTTEQHHVIEHLAKDDFVPGSRPHDPEPSNTSDSAKEKEIGDRMPFICCDSYAMAVYLQPSMISHAPILYSTVITQGDAEVRGMLGIDWYNRKNKKEEEKSKIVLDIDAQAYWKMMFECFQPYGQKK